MRSRALVLERPNTEPSLEEVDIASPGPGEVMVRMVAAGVCGTDGHAVHGTYSVAKLPVVLGHEGAGIIESVGPEVTTVAPGDHVILAGTIACGTCRQCLRGLDVDCVGDLRTRARLGIMDDGSTRIRRGRVTAYPFFGIGTLSEYMTVRDSQVIRIDPDLPLDEFCLVGCGVRTGVGSVLNVGKVQVGDVVVVVGCGGVGANVIQGCRIAGASTVIAVDAIPEKLELAKQLGATHTIDATGDVAAAVTAIEPDGADVVFEVVGDPQLLADCLKLTRVGGTCVMVGVQPPGSAIPVDSSALIANRRLLGARGGATVPSRDIPLLARLYRSGQLQLAPLIGQTVGLTDVSVAFDSLGSSTFARSIVTFP